MLGKNKNSKNFLQKFLLGKINMALVIMFSCTDIPLIFFFECAYIYISYIKLKFKWILQYKHKLTVNHCIIL